MRSVCLLLFSFAALIGLALPATHARADDAGYTAAAYLIAQAARPHRDGRHNALLRGLRQLEDPDLLPFFTALSNSNQAPQRVHGLMGLTELSPQGKIDLTTLAEIEDDGELIQLLSAAMDDGLIDDAGLSTLLSWDALTLAVKQAVALRLIGNGGSVDASPFRDSLDLELNEQAGAGRLLQFALAALILAEQGDAVGRGALDELVALQGDTADAVLAQMIDAAMRRGINMGGPIALIVANDTQRPSALRLLAVQAALRLQADNAPAAWLAYYRKEIEPARRIRLALIALDASATTDPALYDTLIMSGDELQRIIGEAGRAIAEQQAELPRALAPLLEAGQPLATQWVVTYCRRETPEQAADLLAAVIRHHAAGEPRNRGRLIEAAISAVQTLCEQHPDQAATRLLDMLEDHTHNDETTAIQQRQLILLGIVRARGVDLSAWADDIQPDDHNDFTTEALRLLVRARHQARLSESEWARISDIVQGVGQMDPGLRVQLAWLYLKHLGKADTAIDQAVSQSR